MNKTHAFQLISFQKYQKRHQQLLALLSHFPYGNLLKAKKLEPETKYRCRSQKGGKQGGNLKMSHQYDCTHIPLFQPQVLVSLYVLFLFRFLRVAVSSLITICYLAININLSCLGVSCHFKLCIVKDQCQMRMNGTNIKLA